MSAENAPVEGAREPKNLNGEDVMGDWKECRTTRLESQRKVAAESLKKCPLCGAINAVTNSECFACTWHGEFDHDPAHVEAGLGELLIRCPELAEAMIEMPPQKSSFVNRIWEFLKGLRKRSDGNRLGL
jgi:hypothetical protein